MAKNKSGTARKKGKNGTKKYGRYKIKNAGKVTALSAFVRNKITAHQYWAQTGQPLKRG